MAKKVRTYKGKMIDFDEFMSKQGGVQAAGNMDVNARGDLIDKKGRVIKTRDQVAKEYHKNSSKTVVSSSLLDDIDDDLPRPKIKDDPKVKNKKTKAKSKAKKETTESSESDSTETTLSTTKTSPPEPETTDDSGGTDDSTE